MNLTAATAELKARGFDHLTDARCTTMLNRGKNALEGLAAWPWLEANTTGTGTATLTDVRAVQFVQDTRTKTELRGAARDWIRQTYGPDLTTTGTAEWWYLDGSTSLKVYPTDAAATLSVDYIKWSPELSAGGDTPLIPVREHSVWVDFAQVEAYRDSDNMDAAQNLFQYLSNWEIPRLLETYTGRNFQNPDLTVYDPFAHLDG